MGNVQNCDSYIIYHCHKPAHLFYCTSSYNPQFCIRVNTNNRQNSSSFRRLAIDSSVDIVTRLWA
jgi:hypothetical protein